MKSRVMAGLWTLVAMMEIAMGVCDRSPSMIAVGAILVLLAEWNRGESK